MKTSFCSFQETSSNPPLPLNLCNQVTEVTLVSGFETLVLGQQQTNYRRPKEHDQSEQACLGFSCAKKALSQLRDADTQHIGMIYHKKTTMLDALPQIFSIMISWIGLFHASSGKFPQLSGSKLPLKSTSKCFEPHFHLATRDTMREMEVKVFHQTA